jgi:hypothetical protein
MMAKNSRPISSDTATIPRCGYWAASAGGSELASANSIGIAAGLIGKPLGITHWTSVNGGAGEYHETECEDLVLHFYNPHARNIPQRCRAGWVSLQQVSLLPDF